MSPIDRPPRPLSDSPVTATPQREPRYVPLTMAAPEIRLVVDRLWTGHGPVQRLRRLAAASAPDALLRRLAPTRPATSRETARLRAARALLGWPGGASDRGWVLVTDVHDRDRGRLAAIRVDDRAVPREILKIAVRDRGRAALEHEEDALRQCAERLPRFLRDTVPTLLGRARSSELSVLRLSAFDARSQYVDLHGDLTPSRWYGRHLLSAAAWLGAFHRATRRGEGDAVPVAAAHGDFWPGNVLRGPDGTAVVDWEAYAPMAPITDDLLGYLSAYAAAAPGVRSRRSADALRRALLGGGRLANASADFISVYCTAMEIDRRVLDAPLLERLERLETHPPTDPAGVSARTSGPRQAPTARTAGGG